MGLQPHWPSTDQWHQIIGDDDDDDDDERYYSLNVL